MPPVVVAAGIGAAGAIAGGVMQSRSANKATEASERANAEAINFQKEQLAQARQDYEKRWNQYQAGRRALMARYGISLPEEAPAGPGGAVPRAAAPEAVPMGRQLPQQSVGMTLGEMQMRKPEMESWNNWHRYGLE